jgi:hypothetical protein
VAPHSANEICQPFFESAGTRPGHSIAQGALVFRGKVAIAIYYMFDSLGEFPVNVRGYLASHVKLMLAGLN